MTTPAVPCGDEAHLDGGAASRALGMAGHQGAAPWEALAIGQKPARLMLGFPGAALSINLGESGGLALGSALVGLGFLGGLVSLDGSS